MSTLRRHRALSALTLVPALALTAALSACGEEDAATDPGSPGGPGSPGEGVTDTVPSIEHPTGADDVVLSIDTGGGFVPIEYAFTDQPELVLLGDGTLVVPDGDADTLMAPVATVPLDETQVQELLALAEDAGLLGRAPSYEPSGGATVSDAPTTTVVVTAAGATRTHAAYALGSAPGGDTPARERLAGFVDDALALAADAGPTPAAPDRVRILATPADNAPGADATVEDWPVAGADLAGGPCLSLEGEDAAAAAEALAGTPSGTYFTQGDHTYVVVGTAVLPGDEPGTGCPVDASR